LISIIFRHNILHCTRFHPIYQNFNGQRFKLSFPIGKVNGILDQETENEFFTAILDSVSFRNSECIRIYEGVTSNYYLYISVVSFLFYT